LLFPHQPLAALERFTGLKRENGSLSFLFRVALIEALSDPRPVDL
jgi:hypothetical protein